MRYNLDSWQITLKPSGWLKTTFTILPSMGQKSWQSLARCLWCWVPHKPAAKVSVISRLEGGRVRFKLTYQVLGKIQFLGGSSLEAAPNALPRSLLWCSSQFASLKHATRHTGTE